MAPVDGVGAQPEILSGGAGRGRPVNDAGGITDPAGGPKRPFELIECKLQVDRRPRGRAAEVREGCDRRRRDRRAVEVLVQRAPTKAFAAAGIPMVGTARRDRRGLHATRRCSRSLPGRPSSGGGRIRAPGAGAKTIAFISATTPRGRSSRSLSSRCSDEPSDLINETYCRSTPRSMCRRSSPGLSAPIRTAS